MSRDLERIGADLVWEIVSNNKVDATDLDSLRDKISDYAHSAADSACIYVSDCKDIISQYESDPRADTDSADDCGGTFKPSEYRDAMVAYAFWIARSIIEAEASETVEAIQEAIDELTLELSTLGVEAEESDYRLSADCPHGWAAHDRENGNGASLWLSRQLDGCNAVATKGGGIWISYTWESK